MMLIDAFNYSVFEVLLWLVLICPGFISVTVALSLAAIEVDFTDLKLYLYSLVSSIVIDTIFFGIYQHISDFNFNSPARIESLFFSPQFRADMVMLILLLSILLGVVYSVGILYNVPMKARSIIQHRNYIKYHPIQPWETFMEDAEKVMVETSQGEVFIGEVSEWSRAEKPKELRIDNLKRWNTPQELEDEDEGKFVNIDEPSMIILEDNIEYILMDEEDR